ncbi:MAG: LrgB family protein [Clostridiales bacterium]|nr:LrgB family protein [Clostridiales bacterium]
MMDFLQNSTFFGVFISVLAYVFGTLLQKRFKSPLCNPMVVALILTILTLVVLGIDYKTYEAGTKYITFFLTPATVCLALPLYEQFNVLKKNYKAVLLGILSGVASSLLVIAVFAVILGFTHEEYATFLPKSITTAIGMAVSEELGGYPGLAAAIIAITGISGNMMAETVCKLFRITEPMAKGIAIGSASHVMGTTKAMEMGPVEGAMSSLSIVVSGVLTVLAATVFGYLI